MYPVRHKGIRLAVTVRVYSFIWILILIRELCVNFCNFIRIQYNDIFGKSSLLLKAALTAIEIMHMYEFYDDARNHHGS